MRPPEKPEEAEEREQSQSRAHELGREHGERVRRASG